MFGERGDRTAAGDGGDVVSVVGPGMEVEGDCSCEGSLRVDGRVHGTIRAGKSVVVGEDGEVRGDLLTQDAVVAGRVVGSIHAESRLELKDGCRVEGDIRCPSVRLEEGGRVDGELDMSRGDGDPSGTLRDGAPRATAAGQRAERGPDPARPES